MKLRLFLLSLTLIASLSLTAQKNVATFHFEPEPKMKCANCEKKITESLQRADGVLSVKTAAAKNKVSVTYDADKTTPTKIIEAIPRMGQKAAPSCDKVKATELQPAKACDKAKACEGKAKPCDPKANGTCDKGMKCAEKCNGKCEKCDKCTQGKDCCNKKAAASCDKAKQCDDKARQCIEVKDCCKQKTAGKK